MSENFLKADDVTMELATMLDEFSAVDCYRLKKNAPIEKPTKKALSYKAILKTSFPGPSTPDAKYKLPDSIDMDYIDILSGKNSYKNSDVETKIPISMKSFEKLCYSPELTETQKQALIARAEQEAAEAEYAREQEAAAEMASILKEEVESVFCSPCCFDISSSPKKKDDVLHAELESSDSEIDDDAIEHTPLISPDSSTTLLQELSHSLEESIKNMDAASTPATQIVEDNEPHEPSEQSPKENSSMEKRRKTIFQRFFSRKKKK